MSTDYDPIVAHALDQLVAGIESGPDEILQRARGDAQGLKRRRAARIRRTAILAFAALALLIGAALASARSDLLPWFGGGSARSEATFSVDYSRTYGGAAPRALLCPVAGSGSFDCSVYPGPAPDQLLCPDVGPGSFDCPEGRRPSNTGRTYIRLMQVDPREVTISREFVLRALAEAEKNGKADHATVARVRHELDAVSDEFFTALAVAQTVQTVMGHEPVPGRPGFELVPPSGVPMWVACQTSGSDGFSCHDLASSENVAVGTPLYRLRLSTDWIEVKEQRQKPANRFRAILGRDLTPAEVRLFFDLFGHLEPGRSSGKATDEPASP